MTRIVIPFLSIALGLALFVTAGAQTPPVKV
ncbi:MAG: hypothetical protein QOH42_1012, partial [Blastocatellia bacterium]|nr:hypothetical protein [Blastocatellia bacterium]